MSTKILKNNKTGLDNVPIETYNSPVNNNRSTLKTKYQKKVRCAIEKEKALLRRFIPIGTKEEMDKFNSLAEEKNLSRDDLAVILRAIKLNPDISC